MRGTVVDVSSAPIVGATVAIEGTTLGAITDSEGKFLILGAEPGTAVVTVSFIGYKRFRSEPLELRRDEYCELSVTLEPESSQLDGAVVVATRKVDSDAGLDRADAIGPLRRQRHIGPDDRPHSGQGRFGSNPPRPGHFGHRRQVRHRPRTGPTLQQRMDQRGGRAELRSRHARVLVRRPAQFADRQPANRQVARTGTAGRLLGRFHPNPHESRTRGKLADDQLRHQDSTASRTRTISAMPRAAQPTGSASTTACAR